MGSNFKLQKGKGIKIPALYAGTLLLILGIVLSPSVAGIAGTVLFAIGVVLLQVAYMAKE